MEGQSPPSEGGKDDEGNNKPKAPIEETKEQDNSPDESNNEEKTIKDTISDQSKTDEESGSNKGRRRSIPIARKVKVNEEVSLSSRLLEFIGIFPQLTEELHVFKTVNEHKSQEARMIEQTQGRERILNDVDTKSKLVTYYAWCYIFREAIIERKIKLAEDLIDWVSEYNLHHPLTGVEAVVEQIRLFLTLRTGYHSRVLGKTKQIIALEIVERMPVGPLIPFMQTGLETGEFEEMVNRAFNVDESQLFKLSEAGLNTFLPNTQQDTELPSSMEPLDIQNEPIAEAGDFLTDEEESSSSDSDNDQEEKEGERDEEDGKQNQGGAQKAPAAFKMRGAKSVKSIRSMKSFGRFQSFASSTSSLHSRSVVTEKYIFVGTLEKAELLRIMAFEEEFAPFGVFDKKVILIALKNRSTRSDAFTALMSHLIELERASSAVSEIESRFMATMHILSRHSRAFPPSLGIAQALYVEAIKLATLASEFDYSHSLRKGFQELVEETKRVMGIAFDSVRVAHNIHGDKSSRAPSLQRLSSSGSKGALFQNQRSSGRLQREDSFQSSPTGSANRGSLLHMGSSQHGLPTSRFYNSGFFSSAPPNTPVALVSGVWLQIDTDPKALNLNNPDVIGNDEMTSVHPGKLEIYKNRIAWVMVKTLAGQVPGNKGQRMSKDENEKTQMLKRTFSTSSTKQSDTFDEEDLGVNLRHEQFSVYSAVKSNYGISDENLLDIQSGKEDYGIGSTGHQESFQTGRVPELTKSISNQYFRGMHAGKHDIEPRESFQALSSQRGSFTSKNHEIVKESLFEIPMSQIQRYSWGSLDHSSAYLAIYTTEVIKLFPFTKAEAQELVKALHDFTGMKPTTVGVENQDAFKRKLEDTRLKILDENILKRKTKWISHTEELLRVLKDLTKDDAPIKMVEMERLYHSCRNNKAVVFESMCILKELWVHAKTQDTMMKILAIVDRFLDGDILNGDDEILSDTLKWLHTIETTLDPYSNATPLKLLLRICHRAESLQSQTIVPLVEIFYDDSVFDFRESFGFYLQQHENV